MAATQPPGLHFLVSTSVEKPDAKLRKFIRSHVMLGKNRGKKRFAGKGREHLRKDNPPSDSNTPPVDALVTLNAEEALVRSSALSTTVSQPTTPLTIPRKFGWDLAPIHFPDAVEPGAVDIFLKFSSIAKQILFPLEPCVFFERKAETWIAPLTFDAAFLHTMIFMSQYYFDATATGSTSTITKGTLHHLLKALRLLRERMSRNNDQVTLSNSTAAAVMALTSHALLTGDLKSAVNHVEGLHKIVSLRGGVVTFQSHAKLLVDILRCDIGIALHRGSKPVFFDPLTSHEAFLPYPDLTQLLKLQGPAAMASRYGNAAFLNDLDGELSNAWITMSAFCSVANFTVESRQYISIDTYLDTMASIMYRLLNMRFESGSSSEAIRLGLLALSCSVFLQWKPLGLSYAHLTSEFKGCLIRLASSCTSSQLLLWLLMVGVVSVFDSIDDSWLKPLLVANMACCDIDLWDRMQDLLNSFMWIGLIHDRPAKRIFDSTIKRSQK